MARRDRLLGAHMRDALVGLGLAAGSITATITATSVAIVLYVSREVVTPPRRRRDPVRIRAVNPDEGTITLARTKETAAPGTYTLLFGGIGRCQIGEIVSQSERTVTRRYSGETGTTLQGQRFVRLASAPERSLDDVGVPWTEVSIPTELGDSPAWRFAADGDDDDWAIHVHGRGAVLTEPLRSVRLLRDAGWNSLVIAYRNDVGAPRSLDGKFGLGSTEWRDVDAAMSWVIDRGARRILLVGWSMGGATVMQALLESPHRDRVVGVVLESPVISWRATLEMQGRQLRLPWFIIRATLWLLRSPLARVFVGMGEPIPLQRLELMARAEEVHVPILLIHSTADNVVPHRPSAAFARRLPDLVTYEQFDDALHVRNWNVDAPRWEGAWRRWLRRLNTAEQVQDAHVPTAEPSRPRGSAAQEAGSMMRRE